MATLATSGSDARGVDRRLLGLVLALLVLVLAFVLSLALGAAAIAPGTVVAALTAYDGSNDHVIVQTIRLPRALIATTVGASLAVAGTVMQGLTRNPLASPSILGINAGAGLAVVLALYVLGTPTLAVYAWAAFLGAALAAVLVYALSGLTRTGATPLALTVAGAALSAVLSSLTTVVLVLNQRARYADYLIALRNGQIVAAGSPREVITEDMVRAVFDLESRVIPDPIAGTALCIPIGRAPSTGRAQAGSPPGR